MEEINPSTSQYTLTLEPQNHPDESAETKAFKLYRGSFDDDVGEYYFESDHLALKGNGDYRMLLKCVAILEAQRSRAIQVMHFIYSLKK